MNNHACLGITNIRQLMSSHNHNVRGKCPSVEWFQRLFLPLRYHCDPCSWFLGMQFLSYNPRSQPEKTKKVCMPPYKRKRGGLSLFLIG